MTACAISWCSRLLEAGSSLRKTTDSRPQLHKFRATLHEKLARTRYRGYSPPYRVARALRFLIALPRHSGKEAYMGMRNG